MEPKALKMGEGLEAKEDKEDRETMDMSKKRTPNENTS
jgi:hypothetical protein